VASSFTQRYSSLTIQGISENSFKKRIVDYEFAIVPQNGMRKTVFISPKGEAGMSQEVSPNTVLQEALSAVTTTFPHFTILRVWESSHHGTIDEYKFEGPPGANTPHIPSVVYVRLADQTLAVQGQDVIRTFNLNEHQGR